MQQFNTRWAQKRARLKKKFKGNAKRRAFASCAENYDKAKLKSSGLWDSQAAKKAVGSLVITRVSES